MESEDPTSPVSPPFTPIVLSEEPPSPGAVPLLNASMSAFVGAIDLPGSYEITGECPEGYTLLHRLSGNYLHTIIQKADEAVNSDDRSTDPGTANTDNRPTESGGTRLYHNFQWKLQSARKSLFEMEKLLESFVRYSMTRDRFKQ